MSIKDLNPEHDEFEAFLRGEDDLAALLQDLPQFAPSAKLDAAILADAERAIARSKRPLPAAANDAIVPESARIPRPSFASRWKLPLGLAASLLLMFPMVQSMRHTGHGYIVQMPPEAMPYEVKLVPRANAPARRLPEDEPAEFPVLAQAEPPAAPLPPSIEMAPRVKMASPAQLKKRVVKDTMLADAGPAVNNAASKSREVSARTDSSQKSSSEIDSNRLPVIVALADPRVAEQVVTSGIRSSPQQSLSQKRAETHVAVIAAEDVGKMPGKNVTASAQRASIGAEAAPVSQLQQKREADNNIDVIVGADMGASRDRNAAASPRQDGQIASAAAKPAIVAAPANVQPAPLMKDQDRAKVWLAVVEEKLKSGSNSAALDEWTRFRKAYPTYPVPPALIDKIKGLQKP